MTEVIALAAVLSLAAVALALAMRPGSSVEVDARKGRLRARRDHRRGDHNR